MSASLADYLVPLHIDLLWANNPDARTLMGAHGIGEIGKTGVGAAVVNAVFNATGIGVRDLPITPGKLLAG